MMHVQAEINTSVVHTVQRTVIIHACKGCINQNIDEYLLCFTMRCVK